MTITLNLIINKSSVEKYRRRVFAGLHSMYGIASLLAPLGVKFATSLNITWNQYFIILSFIPLIFFVIFLKLDFIPVKFTTPEKPIANRKQLIFLSSMFAAYVSGEILVSSRLVIYLVKEQGMSFAQGTNYLTNYFLLLLIGRLFFSIVHLNVPTKRLLNISIVTSVITLFVGIFYYTPALVLSGLAMSYFFPCAMDWVGDVFGDHADEVMTQIMKAVGGALVAVHWIFGLLSDWVGLQGAMLLAPVLHVLVMYILHFQTDFLAKQD